MNVAIADAELSEQQRGVFSDILSQAITGELVGMANYAALVRLHNNPEEQCAALAHAAAEMHHSERFSHAARELGVNTIVDLNAPYWQRVRTVFLRYADAGDFVACLVVQEVMLESFAVSMYHAVADVAPSPLAAVFRTIGDEEQNHVDHAISQLHAALVTDRQGFEDKVEKLHDEVMTTLAEMLGAKDSVGHCGLCHGECVKGSLYHVGLDRATLRGMALNYYLRTLDRIGIPGERSLAWVARLPL